MWSENKGNFLFLLLVTSFAKTCLQIKPRIQNTSKPLRLIQVYVDFYNQPEIGRVGHLSIVKFQAIFYLLSTQATFIHQIWYGSLI